MGDLVTLDYDNNYDNDDDGYLAVKVRLSWDSMTPLGGCDVVTAGHNVCVSFVNNNFYLNNNTNALIIITLQNIQKNVTLIAFKPWFVIDKSWCSIIISKNIYFMTGNTNLFKLILKKILFSECKKAVGGNGQISWSSGWNIQH